MLKPAIKQLGGIHTPFPGDRDSLSRRHPIPPIQRLGTRGVQDSMGSGEECILEHGGEMMDVIARRDRAVRFGGWRSERPNRGPPGRSTSRLWCLGFRRRCLLRGREEEVAETPNERTDAEV